MYKKKLIFLLAIFILNCCQKEIKIKKEVIFDEANLLTLKEEQILESVILDYEKESLNEIIILTIDSLRGEDINEYSIRKHNELKVGKLEYLNGVLIVISKIDREVRINVGYGLGNTLTDEVCGSILDNYTLPMLKRKKYFDGLLETVNQIKIYAKKDWK